MFHSQPISIYNNRLVRKTSFCWLKNKEIISNKLYWRLTSRVCFYWLLLLMNKWSMHNNLINFESIQIGLQLHYLCVQFHLNGNWIHSWISIQLICNCFFYFYPRDKLIFRNDLTKDDKNYPSSSFVLYE